MRKSKNMKWWFRDVGAVFVAIMGTLARAEYPNSELYQLRSGLHPEMKEVLILNDAGHCKVCCTLLQAQKLESNNHKSF